MGSKGEKIILEIPPSTNFLDLKFSPLSALVWTYSTTIVCQCWRHYVSFWLIMIFGVCVFDVGWRKQQRARLHIRWKRTAEREKLQRIISACWNRARKIYFHLSCSLRCYASRSISAMVTRRITASTDSNQVEKTLLDIFLYPELFSSFFPHPLRFTTPACILYLLSYSNMQ